MTTGFERTYALDPWADFVGAPLPVIHCRECGDEQPDKTSSGACTLTYVDREMNFATQHFEQHGIAGWLHAPAEPNGNALLLTHGAGGNSQAPLLVAVASAFAENGYFVLRYDLPFRRRRKFGPPSPASAADDRQGLRAALSELRTLADGKLLMGGHSYGGRQASMLAAEEPALASALILLSYPLHPPKAPERPRTAHFPELRTPAVFIHGTRDPFGTPDEVEQALRLIPSATQLVLLEGAGHDLARGKWDLTNLCVRPVEKAIA